MTKVEFYREKEFKNTEIGKIPKLWEIKNLKYLANIETGKRAKGGGLLKGNVASIGGEHIDKNGRIIWNNMRFIPEEFYTSLKQGKVTIGDVLLVKDGATTGKVAFVSNLKYDKVAVNEHVFVIKSKEKKIDSRYLFYYIFSGFGQRQIRNRFHGMIGGITKKDLGNIKILLPSLFEQKAIAKVLKDFDDLLEVIEEKIKTLQRIKKGLMEVYFTKGVFEHKKFEDTKIGKIPKEWRVKRLADLFEVLTGTTPSTKVKDYWENGNINWFTPEDLGKVQHIFIRTSRRKITREALNSYNLSMLKEKDIIISTRAPVGYVAIVSDSGVFNQGCKGLTPKKDLNTLFFAYYLKFKRNLLESLAGGSTFKELSKKTLEDILLPFPSIREQEAIAQRLKTVDDQIENLRNQKEVLQKIKKKFMDLLLTGKVRVREV